MADPRFYKKSSSKTLAQIAEICGAELAEGIDVNSVIDDVAPLDSANASAISFFDNVKYKDQLASTKAGAVIVHSDAIKHVPSGTQVLLSKSPYKAYALVAQAFYPPAQSKGGISDHAFVNDSAKIGKNVTIEPGAVIGDNAEIGDDVIVRANAVVGPGVCIGQGTVVGYNATVSHALVGAYVNIYPGVRIGQDGFGFAIDPAGHVKVPQLGRVIIEDHVEIGANTTIDRGAGPDTVIGQGTWIDNLVQIAHNVKIGKGCVLVAQSGVAGSTVFEDFVVLAAQSGVAGHLKIGMGTRIGACSGVMRNTEPGSELLGTPAVPSKEFMRQVAAVKKLIKR